MRVQRAVDSRFDFGDVTNQAGGEREIVRSTSLPLVLEPPVRPAASDADGKVLPLDSELEPVRIAPAVNERVNVNGLTRHHLALQGFAVANEAGGSSGITFDRSGGRRGCVAEVLPGFAESDEIVVSIEASVRPRADQLEYVVDRIDRKF